jgi:hypothetical protein
MLCCPCENPLLALGNVSPDEGINIVKQRTDLLTPNSS